MASNCCGAKKQKMNNCSHNHNGLSGGSSTQQPFQNGYSGQNGHAHNGNGEMSVQNDLVAVPDMCFFCFEVLQCELNNRAGPRDPTFTNDA